MNLKRKNIHKKNIRFKKSSLGLFALILVFIGICFISYNYFLEKKDKVYENMNLLLFSDEEPSKIDDRKKKISEATQNDESKRTQSAEEEAKFNYQYLGVLEIPKINLKRGFLDMNSKYNVVYRNITVVESSSYPDRTNGNFILAAHSGNCYVCFFDKLWKLKNNDQAYVYYKNVKYTYSIKNIYDVKKDGTVRISRDTGKNTLTLITCTHNSETKQTVYILELINKEEY